MIKFENTEVMGWEHAIRGMRNPMNSWEKSDSYLPSIEAILDASAIFDEDIKRQVAKTIQREEYYQVGDDDFDLMKRLRNAGTDHRKFMRMITVYVDITAPLYWWKEFDTYKIGTVANSCSTMHKIHAKEFILEDFSCEHIYTNASTMILALTITQLNELRDIYLNGGVLRTNNGNMTTYGKKDKNIWWEIIQLLPSSYNQKRTVMLNYEVLANIYKSRKNHKLDEWSVGFMDWIKTLPYSELITGEFKD